MTSDDQNKLEKIYSATLLLDAVQRAEFVRQACGEDQALRAEIESLLAHDQALGSFLEKPAVEAVSTAAIDESLVGQDLPFQPQQLLNGRFRLIREVGRGGMGVVYEAFDERLNKRIAIKFARPGFQLRLLPEVISATEIAHPNVCRTYEIHTTFTPNGGVDFLTMEYLSGETLSARIGRRGRLPPGEVCDIASQVCDGLGEVHRKGVIHGDLKSGNIILVANEGGKPKAVITDFGLAGGLGGTPGYMAPELWRGQQASVASDLFALGVILYEALSGQLPFSDDIDWRDASAAKPKPALAIVRRAGRRFNRLISRCIDPEPGRRPSSAGEVSAVFTNPDTLRRFAPAAAVLVVAVLMGNMIGVPIQPAGEPVRLAMLPFEIAPDQEAFAEGVLLETGKLLNRVRSPDRKFSTIPVSEAIARHAQSPAQARLLLGATHALYGAMERDGNRVVVVATVADAVSSQILKELPLEYAAADVSRARVALAGTVTFALDLPPVPFSETVKAPAYRDYATALAQLEHDSTVDEAIASLQRAVALDSESPLTNASLAQAYRLKSFLTSDTHYRELAAKFLQRAQSLNPDAAPVHRVAGLLEFDAGHYERAAERFRRTLKLEPNDAENYVLLARALQKLDRRGDALATLKQAVKAQPGYFKTYQELGSVYYDVPNFACAAAQFRKVVELTEGWPEGHVSLAETLFQLGRYAEAEKELQAAQEIRRTPDALITLGAVLVHQRRFSEAITYYLEAFELAPDRDLPWLDLADAYRLAGRPAEARKAYRGALDLAGAQLAQNPQVPYERALLAYVLARLGNSNQSANEIVQALASPLADTHTLRMAVRTYETLRRREQTLLVLAKADEALLDYLERNPDMADLCRDSRFQQLKTSASRDTRNREERCL